MKNKKLTDNEREALFSSINEALLCYGRSAGPELAGVAAELAEDAEVRVRFLELDAQALALEVAVDKLDERVARILGDRAKTMGKTLEEAYPEIDWKKIEAKRKSA